jgi:hypothetical protein
VACCCEHGEEPLCSIKAGISWLAEWLFPEFLRNILICWRKCSACSSFRSYLLLCIMPLWAKWIICTYILCPWNTCGVWVSAHFTLDVSQFWDILYQWHTLYIVFANRNILMCVYSIPSRRYHCSPKHYLWWQYIYSVESPFPYFASSACDDCHSF